MLSVNKKINVGSIFSGSFPPIGLSHPLTHLYKFKSLYTVNSVYGRFVNISDLIFFN